MITKEQAMTGSRFYHTTLRYKRRGKDTNEPIECRANGKCKTWKTRPNEFRLPVKYGMKECFYITQDNAHEWCATKDEAVSPPQNKEPTICHE